MKKTKKKLVLAKETVRNLDAPGLRWVAGGITQYAWNCTQPADTLTSCLGCTPGNTAQDTWACNSGLAACPVPILSDQC